MLKHPDDYLLSFWARGVSVFITDIHAEAYRELEALFIIDDGVFKQYFTKNAYERALDRGVIFYSDPHAFNTYQKELSAHIDAFNTFFASQVYHQPSLSKEVVAEFFTYTKTLCGAYAKMNVEFTDRAFLQQQENPVIQNNLAHAATYKDAVRAVINMVLFEPEGHVNQLLTILGMQFNIAPSVLSQLTQQEILALFDHKTPDEKSVMQRQQAFVESDRLGGWREGKEATDILRAFKENVVESTTLRGQVASKGCVRGHVKIISVDYADLHGMAFSIEKMQKGDILVAETTAPELIMACKKAGAIITEIGGLMSHAAIVSRELGIPCIIGVRHATQLLHDGDFVEVDANKGIVTILKRA